MNDYVTPAPRQESVAVAGTNRRFPVRRIFCVGRNYAAHVREMGRDPDRAPPFFFTKPADAVLDSGETLPYPPGTSDLHHEIELVIAIGEGGRDIAKEGVMSHLWGATVGLDMTRRDLQREAKATGRPWDFAKGFDHSAPIGALVPMRDLPSLDAGRIWLAVDGEPRQRGDLSELIWPVDEHVSILSRFVALEPGDLIMTGTPAGVGAVLPGDTITGGIDGIGELCTPIGPITPIGDN